MTIIDIFGDKHTFWKKLGSVSDSGVLMRMRWLICIICTTVSWPWEAEFLVTREASLVDMESIKEFYMLRF